MNEHEQLLDDARKFCEPTTGEVVECIPEELMMKLRAAELARGIPGKRSERTQSYATWFVFFNNEIRDRVLTEWRKAKTARKRRPVKGAQSKPATHPSAFESQSKSRSSTHRGLKEFRQRTKPAQ